MSVTTAVDSSVALRLRSDREPQGRAWTPRPTRISAIMMDNNFMRCTGLDFDRKVRLQPRHRGRIILNLLYVLVVVCPPPLRAVYGLVLVVIIPS